MTPLTRRGARPAVRAIGCHAGRLGHGYMRLHQARWNKRTKRNEEALSIEIVTRIL
jgi:hypothetical protein